MDYVTIIKDYKAKFGDNLDMWIKHPIGDWRQNIEILDVFLKDLNDGIYLCSLEVALAFCSVLTGQTTGERIQTPTDADISLYLILHKSISIGDKKQIISDTDIIAQSSPPVNWTYKSRVNLKRGIKLPGYIEFNSTTKVADITLRFPEKNRFKFLTNLAHEMAHLRQRQFLIDQPSDSFTHKACNVGKKMNSLLYLIEKKYPNTKPFNIEPCYRLNIIEIDARLYARDVGYKLDSQIYSKIINNCGDELI